MKEFQQSPLADNTIIVIYGDHEGLNKYYAQDVADSGIQMIMNNKKTIPLIIYNPSIQETKVDTLGGQVDILPTLEYLLGLPEDNRSFYRVGKNLFPKEGFVILHDGIYLSDKPAEQSTKAFRLEGMEMSNKVIQGDLFQHTNTKTDHAQ